MDKDLKPVTMMPTNSTVGMGELVEDTASGHQPADTLDDNVKHAEELGSPPLEIVYSSKEDARVRWKLDLFLLPMMACTYVLNYMDKVALSEASIFGIKEDLNLVGQQYSWSSSIFYLGYLVWQYPSSLLMQKLPIGRYFGVMIFLWGLTACTTAFTKSFATLCVNRVFLGVFESCMSPILTILISQYWTREEQPLRTSLWWSTSAVGSFMADAVTYGLSGKDHSGSKYAVWQVVYLVFGPMTMFWGIVVFFGVNSLLCSEDYVPISHVDQEGVYHEIKNPKPVLPLSVARRVFLEYSNYAEGLIAINAFPRHVSGNLHVSTAEGFAMALEVSPTRVYKFYGNIDDNSLPQL
ncbi:hypothetical protein FNYG_12412 [Fusarium nygamai]|uniref:Major facilitator superfamily (MFS) profile domain-containing protein n=1 Tax=Gibberella nygamai TaxID=42673 RepID=A0A2K0VWG5_GIBNY|nr:hypothetical protein FNYG_12412 [Fusarium nygamai]